MQQLILVSAAALFRSSRTSKKPSQAEYFLYGRGRYKYYKRSLF